MAISLIVKGDRTSAAMAALSRSILVSSYRETGHGEIVLTCPDSDLPAVRQWFAEDIDHGAPFETGSLLCYSDHR